MKKIILAAALCSAAFVGANAQNFEVKAGLGISSFDGSDVNPETDTKFAWKVGLGYNIHCTEAFTVQPAIMFSNKGAKSSSEYSTTLQMNYLEVPVMAAYKFQLNETLNLTVNAGPYFAYGISGSNDVFKDESDGGGGFNRFDYGVGAGVKLGFGAYSIGLDYTYGLNNLRSDFSGYNYTGCVTLGYSL